MAVHFKVTHKTTLKETHKHLNKLLPEKINRNNQ